ncbi:hypothetical protein R5R35_008242 [Gryllus longicercus]|uniref:N-acetyltransferase domain-containing protein n=1 Tax=Gryllus longicercus TaxID=2509291 RepID=A0AAN9VTX5_9ORTH
MASAWPRPSSAPLPMVYRRFKGPRPMPDGRTPNFWIQDITPDQDEQIVDFMSDGFLKEEFMCSRSGLPEDPVSLQEMRDEWRQRLKHRAGLVALTDWPDGPHNPQLAGCNVTYITRRGDPPIKAEGAALRHVLDAMHAVEARVDLFARFGVEAFLNALGLSVAPAFRRQGLGRELLAAREPLLRALGLRLTIAVFTGPAAQKASARAGYVVLAQQRFVDCKDDDGREVFPDVPWEVFQLKAKYIE